MNYWIVPWNKTHYDLDAAIDTFGYVDWRQFFNYEVGDMIFIYSTLPEGRLVYEMVVERVHIPLAEISDRESFYIKKTGWTKEPPKGFVRFRLIKKIDRNIKEFSRSYLINYGMPASVQIPIRIKSELLHYIVKYL